MTGEIVVQGERYKSREELVQTISNLEDELEQLPSETAEHENLARHIERLRESVGSVDVQSDGEPSTVAAAASTEPPSTDEEDEEIETTTDLRDAAENAKLLVCPTCGQAVDFPEVPPLDKTVEQCPNCLGWGKTISPSRVDGHNWLDCKTCQGNGYVPKQDTPIPPPRRTASETPEAPGAVWNPDAQNWNPPPGQQPPWVGATWDTFYGKWS